MRSAPSGAAVRRIATPRSRSTGRRRRAGRGARRRRCGARVSALPFTSSVGWGSINVEGWTPQPGPGAAGRSARRDARTISGRWGFRSCRGGSSPTATAAERAAGGRSSTRSSRSASGRRAMPIGKHVWNDPERADDDRRRRRHGQAVRPRRRRADRRLSAQPWTAGVPGRADVVAIRRPSRATIVRKIHEIDPTITGVRRPDDAGSDESTRWRGSGSRR